jgi:4-hydroxy-tetrahydrodipicolinate reductase
MTIRVAVFGACGRMGQTVCGAVAGHAGMELVGGVDPAVTGGDAARTIQGVPIVPAPHELPPVAVMVDFTHIDAARGNLAWAAEAGVHAVVGTTGFTDADHAALRESFTRSNCVIAPNFAIGAVLMMRFAELAAPWFPTAEIIELHHDAKRDAPSGTALRTAERMAAASGDWGDDPTQTDVVPGTRGGEGPAGIRIHAVRLQGLVAHQEVVLGATGQSLTIRHDSYDRSSFMPGVLLAIRQVEQHPGVTIGLDPLLGL